MNELSSLLNLADEKNWCTRYFCTTCGAFEFRKKLSEFSRDSLIDNLKELNQEDVRLHRDGVLFCFYEASLFKTGWDLKEPLENTPAGNYLNSILEYERIKRLNQENSEEGAKFRRLEKAKRTGPKATYDIAGAIRRKDLLAIDALIAKGADLSQIDENGISLLEKIQLLKANNQNLSNS
jgi:hypothetical protein